MFYRQDILMSKYTFYIVILIHSGFKFTKNNLLYVFREQKEEEGH
jgi:hypothetical protein